MNEAACCLTCRLAPPWFQVGTHWGSPAPSGTGAPVSCTAGGPSAGTSCACWRGSSPTVLEAAPGVRECKEAQNTSDDMHRVQECLCKLHSKPQRQLTSCTSPPTTALISPRASFHLACCRSKSTPIRPTTRSRSWAWQWRRWRFMLVSRSAACCRREMYLSTSSGFSQVR